jgi:hypothetical protein
VSFTRQHNAAGTQLRTTGWRDRITEFFPILEFAGMRPESPVARQSHQRAKGTVVRSPALQVETATPHRPRVSARPACIYFVTTGDTSDRP